MGRFELNYLLFKYIYLFLLSILAAFIYFIYRDNSILFNQILSTFGADCVIIKHEIQSIFPLPNWAVYSLPGGIWVFVLTVLLRQFNIIRFTAPLPIDYLPIVYGIGLEFLQYFHITDGTFDTIDVVLVVLGGFFARISLFKKINTEFLPSMRIQNLIILSGFVVLILSDVKH